jgi:hypothetical protein
MVTLVALLLKVLDQNQTISTGAFRQRFRHESLEQGEHLAGLIAFAGFDVPMLDPRFEDFRVLIGLVRLPREEGFLFVGCDFNLDQHDRLVAFPLGDPSAVVQVDQFGFGCDHRPTVIEGVALPWFVPQTTITNLLEGVFAPIPREQEHGLVCPDLVRSLDLGFASIGCAKGSLDLFSCKLGRELGWVLQPQVPILRFGTLV